MKHLARQLRLQQTDAESRLWRNLRSRNLEGYKFRRQEIIGSYIADFVCFDAKLIVELDGGQHMEQDAADRSRTAELENLGYKVIRFWNHEVLNETDTVLDKVREELINSPSSQPSP
ncbi:MAG TPA: endonuclease domain-containing protein [Gammaproteobacteria bacterium]|nr:endonuclease domain-containing protein [Gammaproteobacteria bacterium]